MTTDSNLIRSAEHQIQLMKRALHDLELVLIPLTHDSVDGKRWHISSHALELHAQAHGAVEQINLLMQSAHPYWPD